MHSEVLPPIFQDVKVEGKGKDSREDSRVDGAGDTKDYKKKMAEWLQEKEGKRS